MVFKDGTKLFVFIPLYIFFTIWFQLSGIIYRINLLKIQQWDVIPNWLASRCSLLLTLFGYHKTKLVSQRTLVGATPEIHQDILFDQMLRNQQQRQNAWRRQQNGVRILNFVSSPRMLFGICYPLEILFTALSKFKPSLKLKYLRV